MFLEKCTAPARDAVEQPAAPPSPQSPGSPAGWVCINRHQCLLTDAAGGKLTTRPCRCSDCGYTTHCGSAGRRVLSQCTRTRGGRDQTGCRRRRAGCCLPGQRAAPGREGSLLQGDALGTLRCCASRGGGKKCGTEDGSIVLTIPTPLWGGAVWGGATFFFFLEGLITIFVSISSNWGLMKNLASMWSIVGVELQNLRWCA